MIFALEIAGKTKNATLILTGRSVLSREKQDALKEVESLGARVEYKQVDVTEKKAVAGLMQSIQKDIGRLDGIIHSAGLLRDNFILKKTRTYLKFRQALGRRQSRNPLVPKGMRRRSRSSCVGLADT